MVSFLLLKTSQHWDELDEFEGDAYERVLTNVVLRDNSQSEAYVYVLKRRK